MKNVNGKALLWMAIIFSSLLWFAIGKFKNLDFNQPIDFIKPLPTVITVDLLLAWIFSKWLWYMRIFQRWLVKFPNLNGQWRGHIQSTWKNAEGHKLDPIPVSLTIKQSFTKLSCVMRTNEMTSYSFIEGFLIDPDKQVRQLSFSYSSRPLAIVRDRSEPHYGTAILDIVDNPAKKLTGEYWTDRQTTGTIDLEFVCQSINVETPIK